MREGSAAARPSPPPARGLVNDQTLVADARYLVRGCSPAASNSAPMSQAM